MNSWNDVRFVLALARSGSIRQAAKSLEVNHTTVARRIDVLEKRLQARLFEKTPGGYVLTASGKIISEAAEEMEDLLLGSERRIEGADIELSGDVHIHFPDAFNEMLCELLAPFSQQHPKLNIHLSCSSEVADLARREADIALRVAQSPPQDMVGRAVAKLPVALFAAADYPVDPAKNWSEYPWVRWAPKFRHAPAEVLAEKLSGKSSSALVVNTYGSISSLLKNGAGIGLLIPCLANREPKLKQISAEFAEGALDVWILIHPDLRGVKRIKAITDLIKDKFDSYSC
ncbi:LysR family transcriptional regulator [Psychromonas aquimarina]|uniref:LysR family transcriptional regulator n=1 Tax=Psychromonas aquimarina TaxID=444919 RepID=UPI00041A214A|nr:LysR family transcriptional regulator [Psychromonas aquimarina]